MSELRQNTGFRIFIGAAVVMVGIFLVVRSDNEGLVEKRVGDQTAAAYEDIDPAEFKAILAGRDPFVVDVHTPEQDHITGTDGVIPYDRIGERLDELPADKEAEIILYCRSGNMSREAARVLAAEGYTNVKNLVGGKKAFDRLRQGKLLLEPDTRDLGEVIYGEVAETHFTLTNGVGKKVVLTRVSTSCGCTKAYLEKNVMVPGDKVDVRVTFDPAVHEDDTDLGEVTRTIYVDTDHPDYPRLESTITASVIKS